MPICFFFCLHLPWRCLKDPFTRALSVTVFPLKTSCCDAEIFSRQLWKRIETMIIAGSTSAFWLGIASTGSVATVHPLQLEHIHVRHLVSAWDCEGGDDVDDVDLQHGHKDFDCPDERHNRLKSRVLSPKKSDKKTTTSYLSELWRKQDQFVAKLWKKLLPTFQLCCNIFSHRHFLHQQLYH